MSHALFLSHRLVGNSLNMIWPIILMLFTALSALVSACDGKQVYQDTVTVCIANIKDNNDAARLKNIFSEYTVDVNLENHELTIHDKQVSIEEVKRKIESAGLQVTSCRQLIINVD